MGYKHCAVHSFFYHNIFCISLIQYLIKLFVMGYSKIIPQCPFCLYAKDIIDVYTLRQRSMKVCFLSRLMTESFVVYRQKIFKKIIGRYNLNCVCELESIIILICGKRQEMTTRAYPVFIKLLQSKKELYFTYLKYPEQIRKHIYTTNIVENLNSRLENTRVNSGGYFQSLKTAEVAVYVTINKIQTGKWKKPFPAARTALYELKQMFNANFSS